MNNPFSFVLGNDPDNLQLKLTDLRNKRNLEENFNSVKGSSFVSTYQEIQKIMI